MLMELAIVVLGGVGGLGPAGASSGGGAPVRWSISCAHNDAATRREWCYGSWSGRLPPSPAMAPKIEDLHDAATSNTDGLDDQPLPSPAMPAVGILGPPTADVSLLTTSRTLPCPSSPPLLG